MKTRTLLIDLDGTLLGSHGLGLRWDAIRRARAVWRARFGKKAGWLRTLRAFHEMKRALEKGAPDRSNHARAASAFGSVFGLEEKEASRELDSSFLEIFPSLASRFFPIPEASAFLEWAQGKFRLVLATNPIWLSEIVDYRVRWADLDPSLFSTLTHVKQMHHCKPSVGYYRELLEKEELDASTCLMVGDDARKDLPAVLAGIPTFLLREGKLRVWKRAERESAPVWAGDFSALREFLTSGGIA